MHIIFRCKTMLNFYIYVCILQASFFSLCVGPCQCHILLLVKEKRGSWLTFRKVWRLSLMQMTCAAFEQCFFVEASCRKSNSKSKPLPQVSLWHSSRKVSGIWNDKSAAHIVKYATSVACHTGTASWRTHLPNPAHPAHIHILATYNITPQVGKFFNPETFHTPEQFVSLRRQILRLVLSSA